MKTRTDFRPAPAERQILNGTHGAELLTAKQLAARWQLPSEKSIYRMAREGQLPDGPGGVVIRLGKRVRFNLEGVIRFEREGGTQAEE